MPLQWYTLPAEGYVLQISAIARPAVAVTAAIVVLQGFHQPSGGGPRFCVSGRQGGDPAKPGAGAAARR